MLHTRHRPDTSSIHTACHRGRSRVTQDNAGRRRRFEEFAMETITSACYQLRFRSLFDEGRALAFPCDAKGHVDMDALSPRALRNYLYARTVVGREFFLPAVLPQHTH
jgi:hypothetical protein